MDSRRRLRLNVAPSARRRDDPAGTTGVVEVNHDTQRLIREMNLSYLLLIQRLLVEDKATAMSSLGVSPQVADVLVALSVNEIAKLASVSQILCSFRFNDHAVLSALTHSQIEVAIAARPLACKPVGQTA
jgi:flagellar transcriptional activator FlhD